MKINELIDKYNELTDSWLKGCLWFEQQQGRTQSQLDKGEARLKEILNEICPVYDELKYLGVKVVPEQKLVLKGEKKW